MAIKDGKIYFDPQPDLQSAVRRFFEILDIKEISNNGAEFHPVRMEVDESGKVVFGSVRVMRTAEMAQLFKEMKEFSGYGL